MSNRSDGKTCQGMVFRANVSHYAQSRKDGGMAIGYRVQLVRRKDLSCPGCDYCKWQDDSFGEIGPDWPVEGIEKAENGKLYSLGLTVRAEDDYNLKLVEFLNEKEI